MSMVKKEKHSPRRQVLQLVSGHEGSRGVYMGANMNHPLPRSVTICYLLSAHVDAVSKNHYSHM